MVARLRRPITILAALALSMSFAAPVAAQSGASFEMIQIQPTATLAGNNTILPVVGTYRCTFPAGGLSDAEADSSNFAMTATQAQGKQGVVTGASGASAEMLTCDGTTQVGTFGVETDRTWKPGQATFSMYVQFTEAVTHDVFRVDVPDTSITVKAGRPAKPPTLTFSTNLIQYGDTYDAAPLAGSPAKGFTLPTYGVAGMVHQLGTTNTKVNPGIPDGPYPFYLQASSAQQAALTAYFAAKVWPPEDFVNWQDPGNPITPQDLLDQSAKEVAGTAPYFVLAVGAGNGWFLEDGFHSGLPISPPMYGVAFDDDFPTGTYTFIGHLVGTNGAELDYSIILTVKRLTPTLTFSTNLIQYGDGAQTRLAGSPAKGFTLPTHGVAGAIHELGTTNTKANPGIVSECAPRIGECAYGFYLKADDAQQATLTAYFAAKKWTVPEYNDQMNGEIAGALPFFWAVWPGAANATDPFLADGFGGAEALDCQFWSSPDCIPPHMAFLQIDDDFPTGTYTFIGHLVGTTGATLDYTITLTVKRI